MSTGASRSAAFSNIFRTISEPASSRRNATSACESRTVAGIILLLQGSFLFLVLRPFLGERLAAGLALQNAMQTGDRPFGDWLQQNAFIRGNNHGARAFLDMEFLAHPQRNHHLALGGKPYVI